MVEKDYSAIGKVADGLAEEKKKLARLKKRAQFLKEDIDAASAWILIHGRQHTVRRGNSFIFGEDSRGNEPAGEEILKEWPDAEELSRVGCEITFTEENVKTLEKEAIALGLPTG